MRHLLRRIIQSANNHAGSLLITGLALVAWQNWRCWRRDEPLAAQMQANRNARPHLTRTPRISVLVAAWNEGDQIEHHLRSFLALQYPSIELILCAGGNDATLELARRYAGSRILVLEQASREGKQRALARCYQYASGEIIYLTDADCRYSDDALVHMLAPLVEDGEQVTTGVSRPLAEQCNRLLPLYLWVSDVATHLHSPTHIRGLLGRNAAVTRTALEQIGGLDFDAPTGTDYHLAQKLLAAGFAIRHVGASEVPSEYPATLAAYRQKQSRWLRNLLLYGHRYGAYDDICATATTLATGVAMLVAPMAALIVGPVVLVGWLLLFAHAIAAKLRYTLLTARSHQHPFPARFFVAIVPLKLVDFVIWSLPLFDILDPKRRKLW